VKRFKELAAFSKKAGFDAQKAFYGKSLAVLEGKE
jgi:hypothetical protein